MGVKTLEAKHPVVSSSPINQNKCKMVAKATETIAKGNIEVHSLQVLCWKWEGCTLGTFCNSCKFPNARCRVAAVDEFGIFSNKAKILVVAEAMVPKEVVDFVGGEVSQCV